MMRSRKVTVFFLRVSSLLAISLLMNGCGGLTSSDAPAVTSWWLKPYSGSAHVSAPDNRVSLVLSVDAIPGLDTEFILALSDDAALTPYSAARWVDYLPELLESITARSLAASGRFEVNSGRAGNNIDQCELELEIQEFFTRLDAAGNTRSVHIAMNGRYQCESGRPLSLQLIASEPVTDDRMKSVVEAFQQGTDAVMRQLLLELK